MNFQGQVNAVLRHDDEFATAASAGGNQYTINFQPNSDIPEVTRFHKYDQAGPSHGHSGQPDSDTTRPDIYHYDLGEIKGVGSLFDA